MGNQKKSYTPEFKFKVVMEAVKEDTLSEISRKYSIGTNVLCGWKKIFLKQGSNIFKTNPDKEKNKMQSKISKLEQMIGKKEVELNLLKNFSDFYESQNTG